MPLPRSVLRRARERDYADDVRAYYGSKPPEPKTDPCAHCGHSEEDHEPFAGKCQVRGGCSCKAFKIQVGQNG